MPWAEDSARRAQLPSNWQTLRLRVLRRDRYACQHRDNRGVLDCEQRANQVDHKARGNDHSLANLEALCQAHHAAKSAQEGVEAREQRGYTARRPSRHPGALD